jgi:hypothetical protein
MLDPHTPISENQAAKLVQCAPDTLKRWARHQRIKPVARRRCLNPRLRMRLYHPLAVLYIACQYGHAAGSTR